MTQVGANESVSSTSFSGRNRRGQLMTDGNFELKVLTLNCWGLKWLSSDRLFRIQHIAAELATGEYDLVGLQEIWSESDFEFICNAVKDVLPYAHYFHSGVIGSGVCVLSRWRIGECLMHRFSLNGYAHHLHRGDWFGGKVVGLAKVAILPAGSLAPIMLHFYATHIHAEYNRENDNYLAHRIVQSFELSQFIKCTSDSADLVIVVGDLNFESPDLGYRIVLDNAQLHDAWLIPSNEKRSAYEESTCDLPDNRYTPKGARRKCPTGKRIDYILYRNGNLTKSSVMSCDVRLKGIADTDKHYSDHAAVCARFKVSVDLSATFPRLSVDDEVGGVSGGLQEDVMLRALATVREGAESLATDRRGFAVAAGALLLLLVVTIDVELHNPALALMAICSRFVITLLIGFCVWHGVIGLKIEEKALKNAASCIKWSMRKKHTA